MSGLTWEHDTSGVDPQVVQDVELVSVGFGDVDGVLTASTRCRGRLSDGRWVEFILPGGPVTVGPGQGS